MMDKFPGGAADHPCEKRTSSVLTWRIESRPDPKTARPFEGQGKRAVPYGIMGHGFGRRDHRARAGLEVQAATVGLPPVRD
jgi:hypothetical protein